MFHLALTNKYFQSVTNLGRRLLPLRDPMIDQIRKLPPWNTRVSLDTIYTPYEDPNAHFNERVKALQKYVEVILRLPFQIQRHVIKKSLPQYAHNFYNIHTRKVAGNRATTQLAITAISEHPHHSETPQYGWHNGFTREDQFLFNPLIALCMVLRAKCEGLGLEWQWKSMKRGTGRLTIHNLDKDVVR